jgi:hypothetical protein
VTVPVHRIRCISAEAAAQLAAELVANEWTQIVVSGDEVMFPSNNPAGVMAVAELAIVAGWAEDCEAARLIGGLG